MSVSNECPVSRNIRLLQNSDPKVRRNAAETLGKSMNKKAVQPLIELLKTESKVEVRRAIILALSFLGGEKTLQILLETLTKDQDLETRRNAAGGLRFFGDKIKAMDLVKIVLKEPDKAIRDVLVGTIIYLRDDSIIPELVEKCKTIPDEELQGCLLEIIGSYDTKEAKELLKEFTGPEHKETIRLIATRAMGKFDDVMLIPHLYDISQNDASEKIRKYATKVLEELSILLGYQSIDQMVLEFLEQSKNQ